MIDKWYISYEPPCMCNLLHIAEVPQDSKPRSRGRFRVSSLVVNSSNCSEDGYYFGQITFVGYSSFFNFSVERIIFSIISIINNATKIILKIAVVTTYTFSQDWYKISTRLVGLKFYEGIILCVQSNY